LYIVGNNAVKRLCFDLRRIVTVNRFLGGATVAATMKDVAELAGVSIKTVSNVVNGYEFVADRTRERVQAAIERTGYRPNLGARNLRKGRTGFIALAVPDLDNPYFAELAGLVITAAHRHDWTVLIEQTHGQRDRELAVVTSAGSQRIDAAILSPLAVGPLDLRRAARDTPLVLLGERSASGRAGQLAVDHVAVDNISAAKAATAYLASLGRRRIAAIGDQPGQTSGTAALRMAGYRQALDDAGRVFDPSLVVPAWKYDRAEGAAAMNRLLDLPEPPDAVFCFNDMMAIGALRAARRRGLSVPEDIAIVGFGDIQEGSFAMPALTTIAPDKKAIADTAVDLAFEAQERGARSVPRDVTAAFELRVRESA
jgi:LacI family transcriptional regulator, repressor for deo operon, udp, cdd, tsx, nupC, and nupG